MRAKLRVCICLLAGFSVLVGTGPALSSSKDASKRGSESKSQSWLAIRPGQLITIAQTGTDPNKPNPKKPPGGAASVDSHKEYVNALSDVSISGTIQSMTGDLLKVSSLSRGTLELKLSNDAVVSAIVSAKLSDLKPGTALDISGDEIYILPFHNNDSFAPSVVAVEDGHVTLAYPWGNTKIDITPQTKIFRIEPASRADLKPGATVFIDRVAKRTQPGPIEINDISFGKNGVIPHMSLP
jgi:hypothetical protein